VFNPACSNQCLCADLADSIFETDADMDSCELFCGGDGDFNKSFGMGVESDFGADIRVSLGAGAPVDVSTYTADEQAEAS
jgi:hypothetical protein